MSFKSKSTVSDVWRFFVRNPMDASTAICNICQVKLRYTHSTTSNLRKHLTRKHYFEYLGIENPVPEPSTSTSSQPPKPATSSFSGTSVPKLLQPTITATVERTRVYPRSSERKKELDSKLVRMVALDMQPLSIVQDNGFKAFVKALDARYELPSRRVLTRELLQGRYEEEKQRVVGFLSTASHLSVTTDIWSARTTEGNITSTAHFVTDDFKMASFVLSTSRMTRDHTAANIASEMKTIFETWGIQEKVQAVVTDNAANMIAAVKRELKLRSIPCFAHSLNLVVQEAIKRTEPLNEVRKKVKAIVAFFHHSTKATDRLKEMQRLHGEPKKLVQDVETRWNSTLAMMKRYCQQHQAVTATLCNLSKYNLCVTDADVDMMNIAVEALEPFLLVTEEMSSESKVTISKVIPFVRLLHKSLTNGSHPTFPLVKELQQQMRQRFSAIEESFTLSAATILDPRFKLLHFINKDATTRTQDRLKEMLSREYSKKTETESESLQVVDEPSEGRECEEEEPPKKKKSIWDMHDSQVEEIIKQTPRQITGPQVELRRYLESPILLRSQDPLKWWQENKDLMPQLSKIAKQFLGIPATSVPAERLFSKAGELVSARRNSLKDSNIDKLLFLNKNML